ncbi:MAG: molecular chaperone HtpG [Epsilonproteobacteria bacterium]|nr:molecular chaperone HtpG [Campylobacterota bacterium]
MAKYQYQTEVGQLLNLMAHSLYSNKEIFLRELISNANDALDKFNYLHLTDEKFKNEDWSPEINIKLDKEDNSIAVSDNGIGMNEEDLIQNLGTIAKSGTKAFLEELAKNKDKKIDSNLIGQFGVGFYSVFMVADVVEVITKKAGEDKAYKFISDGSGEFEVKEVIKDSHGTVVYLKLKEDAKEFLEPNRIKEIVKKYSNHIPYKIYLNYKEEIEEDGKKKIENKKELINEATALWALPKGEIKDEEYIEFYKTTWGDFEEPLTWIHTIAEGSLEYKTLFYIPKHAPADIYRADFKPGVKLYVKRVFITDNEKELLPLYLRFVRGIIDSEDLPLNISREMLQENRILANIKQASVKKILNHIKRLDKEKFDIFIKEYNKLIKEGIYTDLTNKELLLEIVRYKSSAVEGLTSLDEYIEREKDKENRKKEIYYIIGDDENILRHSPLLEPYKKNNLEVLIMDDKEIDEIVAPSITEYKGWKFVDISMVEPPKTKEDEKELETLEKEYKELTIKIKDILGENVKDVKVTNRLEESPSCVVPDSSDPMVSMRHMFKMMGQEEPELPLILELNAKHPLIKKLKESKDEEFIKDSAYILLDSAKLAEGLEVKDKVEFSKRVTKLLNRAL